MTIQKQRPRDQHSALAFFVDRLQHCNAKDLRAFLGIVNGPKLENCCFAGQKGKKPPGQEGKNVPRCPLRLCGYGLSLVPLVGTTFRWMPNANPQGVIAAVRGSDRNPEVRPQILQARESPEITSCFFGSIVIKPLPFGRVRGIIVLDTPS